MDIENYWRGLANAQSQTLGQASGLAGMQNTPRTVTIPERLEVFEKSLFELVGILGRVEDALVGPRPCDPSNKQDSLPTVDFLLERISRQLQLAHDLANGIHRQIVRG